MQRIRAWFVRHYHNLMQIRDTPHAIAGGLAIGVLLGFTPLLGLKTLIAVLLAWMFRCSKLSAAIGVTFHDILWLIWPLILRWQYVIGFWLIRHHRPAKFAPKHLRLEEIMHWKTLNLLWPTLLGSIVMALPIALLCYVVALEVLKRYPGRHHQPPPGS
ncbi:MAG: uncharacterized protein QOD99_231 [Chthoniobacter sp.]|jgi:uncharacterized protein (DUF2062 family)|nr:uncharacterized protein [Chthoniobacter sp.]